MKVIILAAGYATRLYPLTLEQPKSLLDIGNKKMIEYIISKIDQVKQVNEIFIVSNDKFYNNFLEWAQNYKSRKPIKIINDGTKSNQDRLGAVGDIRYVIEAEKIDDDVLVIAGDNLFEFSLKDFYDFFEEKNSCVVALYDIKEKEKASKKFGVVLIDNTNKIIEFEEKPAEPKTSLVSTACYIFSKEDMSLLKKCLDESVALDNLGDFIKWLIKKKDVYGFVFDDMWFDIGSPEQLEEVKEHYNNKKSLLHLPNN
jgi:glucose-1-phosphate thymidylyltransferase